MSAFVHQQPRPSRPYRHPLQNGPAGKSPIVIRRRSRLNPVFLVAAFSAALLFDALSSAAALRIFHHLHEELSTDPAAAIAAVLACAFVAWLIARVAYARFARSRSIDRAAKIKD
jgi:hypothetical protein